jgi:hypothetical protein
MHYLGRVIVFPDGVLSLPIHYIFPIEFIMFPAINSSSYAKQLILFSGVSAVAVSILCAARIYVSTEDIDISIRQDYLAYQQRHTITLCLGIYLRFQSLYFFIVFDSVGGNVSYERYNTGRFLASISPVMLSLSSVLIAICIVCKIYAYFYKNKSKAT